MTTSDPSRFVLAFKALARRSGLLLLVSAAGAASLGGCGDSGDSNSDPFAEFEGVWAIDADVSSIDCPGQPGLRNAPFTLWTGSFTISAGVLSDVVEPPGVCQFDYDVDQARHVATLPGTNPYSGAAPTCTVTLNATSGEQVVLNPAVGGAAPWTFKLLAPVAGKAPTSQIVGSASAVLTLADSNNEIQTIGNCTFVPQVDAHKIAKP